ncbi:MAG: FHA domain-containing protein [Eubacterium sp.]|nr:FHA domain-containing protein [Eubacterium sp.]
MKIVIRDSGYGMKEFDLERMGKDAFSFGRSGECDIVLQSNCVSRSHGVIYRVNGNWYIQDMQSTYGIYCRNQKISQLPIENGTSLLISPNGTDEGNAVVLQFVEAAPAGMPGGSGRLVGGPGGMQGGYGQQPGGPDGMPGGYGQMQGGPGGMQGGYGQMPGGPGGMQGGSGQMQGGPGGMQGGYGQMQGGYGQMQGGPGGMQGGSGQLAGRPAGMSGDYNQMPGGYNRPQGQPQPQGMPQVRGQAQPQGQPQEQKKSQASKENDTAKGEGAASLLGLISLISACLSLVAGFLVSKTGPWLPILLTVTAVTFGICGIASSKQKRAKGIAGLAVGGISLILSLLVTFHNGSLGPFWWANEGKGLPLYEAMSRIFDPEEATSKGGEDNASRSELSSAKVGDIVTFGACEQDNDPENGKEPIEWRVLDKDGDKILLISRYVLDYRKYQEPQDHEITWDTCSLRTWLNGEFYNNAFDKSCQSRILTTNVKAESGINDEAERQGHEGDSPVGKDTKDKVFLLSIPEARKYFSDETETEVDNYTQTYCMDRACQPTEYARAMGAETGFDAAHRGRDDYYDKEYKDRGGLETESTWWWLRERGWDGNESVAVSIFGNVYAGHFPDMDKAAGVRPAIWVSVK